MIKILIVEDEYSIARMYKYKFEASGLNVKIAENGIEGLSSAEAFQPDIILLDLKMPYMTGEEMLKKLRAEDWGKNIKVVILTNISKDEAPSSIRPLNVERYIVKAHSTPKQVLEVVNEILKTKVKHVP